MESDVKLALIALILALTALIVKWVKEHHHATPLHSKRPKRKRYRRVTRPDDPPVNP